MKLNWDKDGSRLYETGIDRGVVYPYDYAEDAYGEGYAWNGLTGVDESPSGADANDMFANNHVYVKNRAREEFAATINAYTYPDEFELLDGTAHLISGGGIRIGEQKRKKFGFAYRTLLGNDEAGDDYGYKIHLIYNCLASPSSRSFETVNNDPNAITFSWDLTTTPVLVEGFKASAHVEVDSKKINANALKALENILYGTETTNARFPSIEELMNLSSDIVITSIIPAFNDGVGNAFTDIEINVPLRRLFNWSPVPGNPDVDIDNPNGISVMDEEILFHPKKNLVIFDPWEEQIGGITATKNEDGSITLNGTSTVEYDPYFTIASDLLGNIFNGCLFSGLPVNGTNIFIAIHDYEHNHVQEITTVGDTVIDIPENNFYQLSIVVDAGATCDNITISPMIRFSDETDPTYEHFGDPEELIKNINVGGGDDDPFCGGTYNVTTGLITNTCQLASCSDDWSKHYNLLDSLSGPDETFTNTYVYYSDELGAILKKNNPNEVTLALCSHLPSVSYNDVVSGEEGVAQLHNSDTDRLIFSFPLEDEFSSLENLTEWISGEIGTGNDFQVGFPISEPTTRSIDPIEIMTHVGKNALYSYAGNPMTIKYNKESNGDA